MDRSSLISLTHRRCILTDRPIAKLGRLLKAERERQGMTQGKLYSISRVSSRTIVAVENGRIRTKRLRMDVIIRLALALDMDSQALMDEASYEGRASTEQIDKARALMNFHKEGTSAKITFSRLMFGFMELSREEQETFARTINAYLGKGA